MPSTYELETLVTYFTAEVRDLKRDLKAAEEALLQTGRVADKAAKEVDSMFKGVGKSALVLTGTVLGLGSAIEGVFRGVKLAAEAEATEASFEVLIGDAQKAQKTLADLRDFALKTSFRFPELLESAVQMTAFGEEAENLVGTMRMLGEVSAALPKTSLQDLSYLFGTLKSQGRAFTIDIRQFAMRGIPIYLELAKVLGLVDKAATKTTVDVRQAMDKMIEHGQVDFDMVEQAFKNMTGPGGKFFGQLEKKAGTLKGLFDTLLEEIDVTLTTLGKTLVESLDLKSVVKQVSELSQEVNAFLKGLDEDTKEAIKIVLVLTAGVLALAAAFTVASFALSLLTGGLNIWLGLAASGVAAGTAWAMSVGGLNKAWRRLKRAAADFGDFLAPALPALKGFLLGLNPVTAAVVSLGRNWEEVTANVRRFWQESGPVLRAFWDLTKAVATTLRDGFVEGFNNTVRGIKELKRWLNEFAVDVEETWENLEEGTQNLFKLMGTGPLLVIGGLKLLNSYLPKTKEELRDLFFYAEFVWKNFGNFVGAGVARALLKFTQFSNTLEHFFKSTVPTAFQYLVDNWKDVFTVMFNIGKVWVENVVGMMVLGLSSVGDIIAGKVQISDIIKDQLKIFNKELALQTKTLKPITFPERVVPQREKDLLQTAIDFEEKTGDASFNRFVEKKMKEWNSQDWYERGLEVGDILSDAVAEAFRDMETAASQAGGDAGRVFGQEFKKEFHKWDATLFDSAEARARVQQYREMFPTDIPHRVPNSPVPGVGTEDMWRLAPGTLPRPADLPHLLPDPDAVQRSGKLVDPNEAILRALLQIVANTLEIAKKDPVVLQPADING